MTKRDISRRLSIIASVVLVACSPAPGPVAPDAGGDGGSEGCDELGLPDRDGDGIPDREEGGDELDSDGDGTPDYRDVDSDGDGHGDAVEAGMSSCEGAPRDLGRLRDPPARR